MRADQKDVLSVQPNVRLLTTVLAAGLVCPSQMKSLHSSFTVGTTELYPLVVLKYNALCLREFCKGPVHKCRLVCTSYFSEWGEFPIFIPEMKRYERSPYVAAPGTVSVSGFQQQWLVFKVGEWSSAWPQVTKICPCSAMRVHCEHRVPSESVYKYSIPPLPHTAHRGARIKRSCMRLDE